MRAFSIAAALVLVPAAVRAEDARGPRTYLPAATSEVVGGTDAPLGKWPDCAAVRWSGQQTCTGTLIAPTVAITAGHCSNRQLDSILVGTNSLQRVADGEVITVTNQFVSDDADVTILMLAQASRFAPRAIASGWASFDIKNGAAVAIVGYGATNAQASEGTPELQEATSTITDFDCSVKAGCDANELGAGGNGIDSCNGDSGGPLYLVTDYGEFLVGVTSRAYDDANDPCGEGGIYGRPDKIIDWIESVAGVPVARGPEPTAPRIEALRNAAGETVIETNDPKSDSHTFEITTPPAHGTAKVRSDGRIRVCVNPDAVPGDASDSLVIQVTDKQDATRTLATKIQIAVGTDAADGTCDVDDFSVELDDGGGCCDSGRGGSPAGAGALALLVLVTLRRRR
ncbi:MAG: trypsin-like serine protease [Kofleriaceae bacterium]